MIKRLLFIGKLILAIFFSSCSPVEEPQFQRLQKIRPSKVSVKEIGILGEAVFYNPNPVGITTLSADIKVDVEGKYVGNVKQIDKSEIAGSSEFILPLDINFKPKDISSNILESALSIISNQAVKIRFYGTVRVLLAGVEIDVPLDDTRIIDLKNNRRVVQ